MNSSLVFKEQLCSLWKGMSKFIIVWVWWNQLDLQIKHIVFLFKSSVIVYQIDWLSQIIHFKIIFFLNKFSYGIVLHTSSNKSLRWAIYEKSVSFEISFLTLYECDPLKCLLLPCFSRNWLVSICMSSTHDKYPEEGIHFSMM